MLRIADINDESKRKLKKVGFWWSEDEPNLPHPKEQVDPQWNQSEREKVLEYLKNSYVLDIYSGFSWCRMGCKPFKPFMGIYDMTDGVWVYPDGLAHYIESHQVKPSMDFLNHIRSNNYLIPDLPLLDAEDYWKRSDWYK